MSQIQGTLLNILNSHPQQLSLPKICQRLPASMVRRVETCLCSQNYITEWSGCHIKALHCSKLLKKFCVTNSQFALFVKACKTKKKIVKVPIILMVVEQWQHRISVWWIKFGNSVPLWSVTRRVRVLPPWNLVANIKHLSSRQKMSKMCWSLSSQRICLPENWAKNCVISNMITGKAVFDTPTQGAAREIIEITCLIIFMMSCASAADLSHISECFVLRYAFRANASLLLWLAFAFSCLV